MAELLDLWKLIVEEAADEAVELVGTAHVHPHCHAVVLVEDGGLRVLEDDVVAGVAAVELALDLGFEVVIGVFRLPIAACHAERVLHRSVGPDA